MYKDGTLCLYHPRYHEWDPSDRIDSTILPWTSEWLYFYETWVITGGEWLGEGEHPQRKKPKVATPNASRHQAK